MPGQVPCGHEAREHGGRSSQDLVQEAPGPVQLQVLLEEGVMSADHGFELTFIARDSSSATAAGERGGHTVHVAPTSLTGPGGYPVYADATGIIRAEISERGEVRMLATGFGQEPALLVRCVPSRGSGISSEPSSAGGETGR